MVVNQRVERARPAGEVEELLGRLSESDDVAVFEHEPHETMRPVERQRRHLEEAKQMSGRRRVDDDAGKSLLGQRVAEQ